MLNGLIKYHHALVLCTFEIGKTIIKYYKWIKLKVKVKRKKNSTLSVYTGGCAKIYIICNENVHFFFKWIINRL